MDIIKTKFAYLNQIIDKGIYKYHIGLPTVSISHRYKQFEYDNSMEILEELEKKINLNLKTLNDCKKAVEEEINKRKQTKLF